MRNKPTADALSHVERVYLDLRRAIVRGELTPGAALSETLLATRHAASRTPIREALTRLQQDGLIERFPGRGWFVARVTMQLIHDTFEVRRWLEGQAAGRAAELATEDQMRELRALADFKYSDTSYRPAEEINRQFHLAVARASRNQFVVELVQRCLSEFDRFMALGVSFEPFPYQDSATDEHLAIVAGIEQRDPRAAQQAMDVHLEACSRLMLQALMRNGGFRDVAF